jgi:Fe-S oxidoreductase
MKSYLDWSAYAESGMGDAYADIPRQGGDFAKAVAVCIKSRQCETRGKGLMCPSFKATGNPNLSPGGRVRLLKAALNGDPASPALLGTALADPGLAEAMGLCVACKGCKRECEASVDMALIKTEYLAQRHGGRGAGLRARLFAHLPLWQHRWPWLNALVRWRNRSPWLARLAERWLGIAAGPRLPVAVRTQVAGPRPIEVPFGAPAQASVQVPAQMRAQVRAQVPAQVPAAEPQAPPSPASGADPRPLAVLLVDTFTRLYEPAIAEAAAQVLRAAGFRVEPAAPAAGDPEPSRPLCCGRTYLAQGMVAEARAEARRLIDALLPQVRAGGVVVGLEPSCLLGLRDDYRALGLGEAALEVGRGALLLEELLAREAQAGRLHLGLRPAPAAPAAPSTLVHGHCHQKAAGAMKSMRKVLKLIPGLDFDLIEAGCCGMAGAFGLEREHADLAGALAEQALLPALRAQPEAPLIANGFACRQQIRDRTGRAPRHLAELLREALPPDPSAS